MIKCACLYMCLSLEPALDFLSRLSEQNYMDERLHPAIFTTYQWIYDQGLVNHLTELQRLILFEYLNRGLVVTI